MGSLYLEVVTPEKVLVSQEVDLVMAPGSEGEFGILPEHINFLSGIIPGTVRFDHSNTIELMSVTTGFAEISENKVAILVDSAEKASDIDIERAQESRDRAKERLAMDREAENIDLIRAEASLGRAISRIKVAKRVE